MTNNLIPLKPRAAATVIQLWDAVNRVGRARLERAFKDNPFIYGTGGTGNKTFNKVTNAWFAKAQKSRGQNPGNVALQMRVARELQLFEPGMRSSAMLHNGYQMMDMYYGNKQHLHANRIPAIAEFVHYALGFQGKFSMAESGRDAYMRTHKTTVEGWAGGSPLHVQKNAAALPQAYTHLTTTKEISRVIRWAIEQLGGVLVFEGAEVYYGQVFEERAPYVSDTDLEARNLFTFFKPGLSTVRFGNGRIVFHWFGIETVPTQLHFRSNWRFRKLLKTGTALTHQPVNFADEQLDLPGLMPIWKNFSECPAGFKGTGPIPLLRALKTVREATAA